MALFVLSLCPFYISVSIGDFVIGVSQISSFFPTTVDGFRVSVSKTYITEFNLGLRMNKYRLNASGPHSIQYL